jgi:hypothetical protein
MAALTDERPADGAAEPLEGQPSVTPEGTREGEGGGQAAGGAPASLPDLTPEQVQTLIESREDLKRWHQSETDRKAAAQADAWNKKTEADRLLAAQRADDQRYDALREKILDGQVLAEDEETWFTDHRATRRTLEAKREVVTTLAQQYEEAYKRLPDLKVHHDNYAHGADFVEAVYNAGRASRDPEIQAEAKKLAAAMTTEQMAEHRAVLPSPDLARTSAAGATGQPRNLDEARAWHVAGQTPSGRPFTNDDMRRYQAASERT